MHQWKERIERINDEIEYCQEQLASLPSELKEVRQRQEAVTNLLNGMKEVPDRTSSKDPVGTSGKLGTSAASGSFRSANIAEGVGNFEEGSSLFKDEESVEGCVGGTTVGRSDFSSRG